MHIHSITIYNVGGCQVTSVVSSSLQHYGLSSLSVGISRSKYWSDLPCPPPGDLPDSEPELASSAAPALQADSLLLSHQGRPTVYNSQKV